MVLNAMIPMPGETFNARWSSTGSGPARLVYHASIGLRPEDTDDDAVIHHDDLPVDVDTDAKKRTWQDQ